MTDQGGVSLREFFQTQHEDLKVLLNERHASTEKALELRSATLDKEFHEHMAQYRNETEAVLASNDKAIAKAEATSDQRFNAHAESSDALFTDLRNQIVELRARIDLQQGRSSGYSALYGWAVAGTGIVITVILFVNGYGR